MWSIRVLAGRILDGRQMRSGMTSVIFKMGIKFHVYIPMRRSKRKKKETSFGKVKSAGAMSLDRRKEIGWNGFSGGNGFRSTDSSSIVTGEKTNHMV